MRIKLSYAFPEEPILRQTPAGLGVWKGHTFVGNDPDVQQCDMWVVLDDILDDVQLASVRLGWAILITLEPPQTREYQPGFLEQFDLVVTCHRNLPHSNVRVEYQGQVWHIGMHKGADANDRSAFHAILGYDELLRMPPPPKTAKLSVLCSASTRLPGHRARREFVDRLQSKLGDRIDVFGRGIRPVADKADAILPYRYHVALENTQLGDYWTEKLSDSYLGWSFPIYWGAPNIGDYLPKESLLAIEIEHPEQAIAEIERIMDEELTRERMAGLAAARSLVLDRYNMFDVVLRHCLSLAPASAREIEIAPQRRFRPSRARRLVRKAVQRLPLLFRAR